MLHFIIDNHLSGEVKIISALCIIDESRGFELGVVSIHKVQNSSTLLQAFLAGVCPYFSFCGKSIGKCRSL